MKIIPDSSCLRTPGCSRTPSSWDVSKLLQSWLCLTQPLKIFVDWWKIFEHEVTVSSWAVLITDADSGQQSKLLDRSQVRPSILGISSHNLWLLRIRNKCINNFIETRIIEISWKLYCNFQFSCMNRVLTFASMCSLQEFVEGNFLLLSPEWQQHPYI